MLFGSPAIIKCENFRENYSLQQNVFGSENESSEENIILQKHFEKNCESWFVLLGHYARSCGHVQQSNLCFQPHVHVKLKKT